MKLIINNIIKVTLTNQYWVIGKIIKLTRTGAHLIVLNKGNTSHAINSYIYIYPHLDTIEHVYEPNQLLKNLI